MMTKGPEGSNSTRSRKVIAVLVIAIAAWGVYLAIGATGIFTDVGLYRSSRAVIVLLCSTLFLGSWLGVLAYRAAKKPLQSTDSRPVNWASFISLGMSLSGFALWLAAYAVWQGGDGARTTTALGWISAVVFGASAITALIGASDPRPSRGKLTALITLLLMFVAIALFVWQVDRFNRRRAVDRPMPSLDDTSPPISSGSS